MKKKELLISVFDEKDAVVEGLVNDETVIVSWVDDRELTDEVALCDLSEDDARKVEEWAA